MSSNPNNAVGTNAAYSGRTSVNAFNDDLAAYTSGILSGWDCVPRSGLTLALGGDADTRDVAIALDSAGNKTTINNISGSPINVTISSPPASNSRIDAIVAYVDNPPQGVSTTADNPAACGLITVEGTAALNPTAPNDSAIRTAITADGASGSTAYYAVLALVTVASGTTDITSDDIEAGSLAQIGSSQIADEAITSDKIDFTTIRTVLWEGRTNSNITDLTDDVENYDYIEVYCQWRTTGGKTSSTKIYDTTNGAVLFCGGFENAQNAYFAIQELSFSQKTVSFEGYMQVKNVWGTSGMSADNSNKWIYITRIVGVKCSV